MERYKGKHTAPSSRRKGRYAAPRGKSAGAAGQKSGQKMRITRRDMLIFGVPMVAALLAIIIVLLVADRESSYRIQEKGFQYYGGTSASITANTELKISENGDVVFTENGNETTLPIYLENSRKLILTTDMLYYTPRSGSYTKAAAFSEIHCQENGMITVSRNGQHVKPEAGFLYDGKDFYLFLEPVVVHYMNYKVELPALSYAEVTYGGNIMLFNYATKEFAIEALEGVATAQTAYSDYTISLLGDSIMNAKEELTLLMTKPREIDPMV